MLIIFYSCIFRLLESMKMPVASRTSSGFNINDILELNEAKPTAPEDTNGKNYIFIISL